jgi:hypothetical protein
MKKLDRRRAALDDSVIGAGWYPQEKKPERKLPYALEILLLGATCLALVVLLPAAVLAICALMLANGLWITLEHHVKRLWRKAKRTFGSKKQA